MPRPIPPPRRPPGSSPVVRLGAVGIPAVGVVAAALTLAGIAVLLVVGIWASRLGAPPDWAFDCDDTTCTDLWAAARHRYLRVAVLAAVAVLLGAGLGSLAVPRTPVPRRPAPRPVSSAPRGLRLRAMLRGLLRPLVPLLLAAALLWGASWSAVALSRPFSLAVALLALLLAAFSAWRWLRPGATSDRAACWAAVVGTMTPVVVVGGVLVSYPPALLGVVLMLGTPLLGVPMLAGLFLGGAALMGRLLPRAAEPAQRLPAEAPSALPTRDGMRTARPRALRVATCAAVVGIAVLAGFAAQPVPAPPADAWQYAGAPDAGTTRDGTEAGGTAAEEPPEPSAAHGPGATEPAEPGEDITAPAAPAHPAADQPTCSPESLHVDAAGGASVSADSAVTLRATNLGAGPCALHGAPRLTLEQGGEEIALRPEPLTHLSPTVQAADGIGLAPGDTARSRLFWPGYRNAADQRTPQQLTVRFDGIEGASPIAFLPTPSGDDPGPAPFDLKAGVEGGAAIEVGPWEPDPGSVS
ncbi:MAG: DUF4232 domain-containing protein [Brachybacterium sp.]|nr:DUF4232 domain-containing protein [Brachybacterium sp.]